MAAFVTEWLQPLLSEEVLQKAPQIPKAIENALSSPTSKGSSTFDRIASGPAYQGKVKDMLKDLIPSILPQYEEASASVDDSEAMRLVAQGSAVDKAQKDAALRFVDIRLPPGAPCGANSRGSDCEAACKYRRRRRCSLPQPNVHLATPRPTMFVRGRH